MSADPNPLLVPDLEGVPEDDDAEPDDADVPHTATAEDVAQ